ncbi:MAG TPA: hypothetical protein VFA05_02815 [Gaiellaceae bacterium]|nr:hypothetical protein [Gaiellaceae bacterium]
MTTSALRGRASGWAAVPGRPHELVVKTTAAGDRALTLTPCG